MRPLVLVVAIATVGSGCGSNSDSSLRSNDAGTGGAAGAGVGGGAAGGAGGSGGSAAAYPAPHPPMPQAKTAGGPVMTAPKIVAITFSDDALAAQIDAFVDQVAAATAYWSGATAEYGVGPLTALPPEHVQEPGPTSISDTQIQAWLANDIVAIPNFPQPDANTLYAIFFPDTSTVTAFGGTICSDFQGYHSNYVAASGAYVSYAVIGRCPPPVPNITEMDEVTAEASHEFIEAATDPVPDDAPAWYLVDADHHGWELVGGGAEIGDLCAPDPGAFYKPQGVTNLVQRVWSNAAAAASHDPCEPDGRSPYFNSAPVLDDSIQVIGSPIGSFTTKGAHIPVGSSKTIEVDLYSDAPTSGPWKVSALDLTSAFFGGPAALSFSFDKGQGQNGDKLQLTIKALSKSPLGASPFWIINDLGGVTTIWVGLVGN